MFKFGKNTSLQGPYAKYQEPVTAVTGSSQRNKAYRMSQAKKEAVTADAAQNPYGSNMPIGNNLGPSGMSQPGTGVSPLAGGYYQSRYNPVYDFLEEGTLLESWIPRDASGLDMLFRRMVLRDPTIGPGIRIIKSLPWSDFSLDGVKDEGIKRIYEQTLASLNPELLMPDITGEFLTVGKEAASLIFDERNGIFSGLVAHDPDFLRITPMPIYGYEPLVDLKISPGFRRFLTSADPRMADARKSLPPNFLALASKEQGFLPLDPISTIYLARKESPFDHIGTSLLTCCLYFWAIEKALLNAQMASTRRRSRPFIHLMAGIDNVWEPTPQDLDALAGMLMSVNEDPVGGVVATRTGVTISEPVGGGQDFYKWSDELELFAKYKMQAIGISDALLNGDATYANAEQARSVFVESLAGLRSRITTAVFYNKIFPIIARLHGFVKRPKSHIEHNIRVSQGSTNRMPVWAKATAITSSRLTQRRSMQVPTSELIMPTINWTKQLRPNQDRESLEILEKLQQNEYPVTLKQWATAAGLDSETIKDETISDKKMRADIERITNEQEASEKADQMTGGPGEEGGETEAPGEAQDAADKLLDELEKEPTASVYHKSKYIATGKVNMISQLPIWNGNRCGKLGRTEAIACYRTLLTEYPRSIFEKPKALWEILNLKLGGEKAMMMAYVLDRLGITRLPIDESTARTVAEACTKKLTRHSSFNSEKSMLDLKRYETEIKILASLVPSKIQKDELVKGLGNFREKLGAKIYSGV
jgi:hypothetical protein